MKAYKITGKLGDICSFVGGNEVKKGDMVYLHPEREWVGLTQEDIDIAFDDTQEGGGFNEFARAIEAKLKEKNT